MIDLMRGLRRQVAGRLTAMGRSRRANPAAVATPVVAVAGVAAVAGLLLWDERRRVAMRRRMDQVVNSVGASVSTSLNRVSPPVPTGAGRD